jgi:hypothetical protein
MPSMTSTMTIDRYRYISTLRAAGVDEKLANAHAQGLADALQETVATKADLIGLQTHTDTKFAAVDAKLDLLRSNIDLKLAEAKTDTRTLGIAVLIPRYALAIGGVWTVIQSLRQPTATTAVTSPVRP